MNIVILHTESGISYAKHIRNSIKWINEHKRTNFNPVLLSVNNVREIEKYNPDETIIHSRAANPNANWMDKLVSLEEKGYKVINNTNTLKLTSNKLACTNFLTKNNIKQPEILKYRKDSTVESKTVLINYLLKTYGKFICKPVISQGQGIYVKVFSTEDTVEDIMKGIDNVPGNIVIIQEFINYISLFRIIVIGGKALPYVFYDKPTEDNWKVSVCLNKNIMFQSNPSPDLLYLAEQTQEAIKGEINFIDIFNTPDGFIVGEINTACNLRIHELKAKKAGHKEWNIHYRIARYLTQI